MVLPPPEHIEASDETASYPRRDLVVFMTYLPDTVDPRGPRGKVRD
jgi:hypothetical protein